MKYSDDFLSAEQLLIARLRERVPQLRAVLSAVDLESVQEASQQTPAAHVLFEGYQPGDEAAQGARQKIIQLWTVLVVVRNARGARDVGESRGEAGPLMLQVLRALQGWKPSADHGELKLAPSPWAPTYRSGVAYMPLAFSTQVITFGEQ